MLRGTWTFSSPLSRPDETGRRRGQGLGANHGAGANSPLTRRKSMTHPEPTTWCRLATWCRFRLRRRFAGGCRFLERLPVHGSASLCGRRGHRDDLTGRNDAVHVMRRSNGWAAAVCSCVGYIYNPPPLGFEAHISLYLHLASPTTTSADLAHLLHRHCSRMCAIRSPIRSWLQTGGLQRPPRSEGNRRRRPRGARPTG